MTLRWLLRMGVAVLGCAVVSLMFMFAMAPVMRWAAPVIRDQVILLSESKAELVPGLRVLDAVTGAMMICLVLLVVGMVSMLSSASTARDAAEVDRESQE